MEIKTTAKWSSATWIFAAGSKLCTARVCMSALGVNEMRFCESPCPFAPACHCVCIQYTCSLWAPFAEYLCQVAVVTQELWMRGTRLLPLCWPTASRRIGLVRLYLLNYKYQTLFGQSQSSASEISITAQNHTRWCRLLFWREKKPDSKTLCF